MKYKAVLFDLDGTLLPMDQDEFVGGYFKFLIKKLIPYGYEPKSFQGAMWKGVDAMTRNDGSCTNDEAFWAKFTEILGPHVREHEDVFEDFYGNEFNLAKQFCGENENARKVIDFIKSKGVRLVLATNPLFPPVATNNRMGWVGLEPSDFEYVTTYDNSHYCKPNPAYFQEVMDITGLDPKECLMVGNDMSDDTPAALLGMDVFIVTDCLINKEGMDIEAYPHGDFNALMEYLKNC